MGRFLLVLELCLLPAAGNFAGAVGAECFRFTERRLSLALHAAAGVVLAVVAVEIMPEALRQAPPWLVIASFAAGGCTFIGLDLLIENIQARIGRKARGSGPWTVYAAVAIDLFSDGVMIAAGLTVSPHLGVVLALGQGLADIPQSVATMALFRQRISRPRRLAYAALLSIPIYAGATFSYFLLRGRSPLPRFGILGLTAGLLTVLAVEELIPQAHERHQSQLAAAVFTLSFAGFIALARYV
jgi:ZIP family zinc transporter